MTDLKNSLSGVVKDKHDDFPGKKQRRLLFKIIEPACTIPQEFFQIGIFTLH